MPLSVANTHRRQPPKTESKSDVDAKRGARRRVHMPAEVATPRYVMDASWHGNLGAPAVSSSTPPRTTGGAVRETFDWGTKSLHGSSCRRMPRHHHAAAGLAPAEAVVLALASIGLGLLAAARQTLRARHRQREWGKGGPGSSSARVGIQLQRRGQWPSMQAAEQADEGSRGRLPLGGACHGSTGSPSTS